MTQVAVATPPKKNTWQQTLKHHLERILNTIFAITARAASIRRILFLLSFFGIWATLAYLFDATVPSSELSLRLFGWVGALFAPDVLMYLLALILPYWLARRLTAIYLDDIFEINDIMAAETFLRTATFDIAPLIPLRDPITGWVIPAKKVIDFSNGEVSKEAKKSTLFKLGGPGWVTCSAETVAVFEKMDGEVHIVGPSGDPVQIEGFERLRQVLDLREIEEEMGARYRTRDGIFLQIKDVKARYSIERSPEAPKPDKNGYVQPYSFNPEAIKKLVYGQPKREWHRATINFVEPNLRTFISRHKFSELLSNALPDPAMADKISMVPREKLSELIWNDLTKVAANNGIQLIWLGAGVWDTVSEPSLPQHIELWQTASVNHRKGLNGALSKKRDESRQAALLNLIQQTPLMKYNIEYAQNQPPQKIIFDLLVNFREVLNRVYQNYKDKGETPPDDLKRVLLYLNKLTNRSLGKHP
ncbi:MAG: hypothetical protein OHK0052_02300 [Anaerolineales bacterium]